MPRRNKIIKDGMTRIVSVSLSREELTKQKAEAARRQQEEATRQQEAEAARQQQEAKVIKISESLREGDEEMILLTPSFSSSSSSSSSSNSSNDAAASSSTPPSAGQASSSAPPPASLQVIRETVVADGASSPSEAPTSIFSRLAAHGVPNSSSSFSIVLAPEVLYAAASEGALEEGEGNSASSQDGLPLALASEQTETQREDAQASDTAEEDVLEDEGENEGEEGEESEGDSASSQEDLSLALASEQTETQREDAQANAAVLQEALEDEGDDGNGSGSDSDASPQAPAAPEGTAQEGRQGVPSDVGQPPMREGVPEVGASNSSIFDRVGSMSLGVVQYFHPANLLQLAVGAAAGVSAKGDSGSVGNFGPDDEVVNRVSPLSHDVEYSTGNSGHSGVRGRDDAGNDHAADIALPSSSSNRGDGSVAGPSSPPPPPQDGDKKGLAAAISGDHASANKGSGGVVKDGENPAKGPSDSPPSPQGDDKERPAAADHVSANKGDSGGAEVKPEGSNVVVPKDDGDNASPPPLNAPPSSPSPQGNGGWGLSGVVAGLAVLTAAVGGALFHPKSPVKISLGGDDHSKDDVSSTGEESLIGKDGYIKSTL